MDERSACGTAPHGTKRRVLAAMAGLLALLAIFAASAAGPGVKLPEVEPRFIRFGAEHGLPTMINDLAVDRQGYVWLATADGLARYDGQRFRFWRHEVGVETSLPDNELIALAVDAEDRVWVISYDHLSVLDQSRRLFRNIEFPGRTSACGQDITTIAMDFDDGVLVATYAGIVCAIAADGRVRYMASPLRDMSVRAVPATLWSISSGEWLLATDMGVWYHRNGRITELAPHLLGQAQVFSITPDIDGSLWIGTDRGLFSLSAARKVTPALWRLPPLADNAIVRRDPDGGYWIGTAVGLFHAATRAGSVRSVHGGRQEDGLSSGVYAMNLDREGGLWIASYSQGISFLPRGHRSFAVIDGLKGKSAEEADFVSAIEDGAGGYWVVGSRMLYRQYAGEALLRQVVSADELQVEWLQAAAKCVGGQVWLWSLQGVWNLIRKQKIVLKR